MIFLKIGSLLYSYNCTAAISIALSTFFHYMRCTSLKLASNADELKPKRKRDKYYKKLQSKYKLARKEFDKSHKITADYTHEKDYERVRKRDRITMIFLKQSNF